MLPGMLQYSSAILILAILYDYQYIFLQVPEDKFIFKFCFDYPIVVESKMFPATNYNCPLHLVLFPSNFNSFIFNTLVMLRLPFNSNIILFFVSIILLFFVSMMV